MFNVRKVTDINQKAVWNDIDLFVHSKWNTNVVTPLKELTQKFNEPTYAPTKFVRTLFSTVNITKAPINPKKALTIAENSEQEFKTHNGSRQGGCITIVSGLGQLLLIYEEQGERCKAIIKTAFQLFLGISPEDGIKAFQREKEKIFYHHNISPLLMPDTLDGSYVLVSENKS